MRNVEIAPSILAADWGRLDEEVDSVLKAGANWIHVDVMDGHFVPPITIGAGMVSALSKKHVTFYDVHLMIENPDSQIETFVQAGANLISVHVEACKHLHRTLSAIRDLGIKAGVALNPATPLSTIEPVLDIIDLVLIMSVNPGWGGQKFIPNSITKIQMTRDLIEKSGRQIYLEVDGGITNETGPKCLAAGADVLVAGTYIFSSKNYSVAVENLRK